MNVKKSNLPFRVLFVLKEGKRETREGEKKGNKLAGEKLPKFETANPIPQRVTPVCFISSPTELILGRIVKSENVRFYPHFSVHVVQRHNIFPIPSS